jgi:very-short-patch-repair endonuclease
MPEEVPPQASSQHGLFSRQQAYDAGWTPRQVRRRLVAGRWRVVAGLALGANDVAVGPWQLASAVVLTWPDAVVSHELAGALWRFPVAAPTLGTATVAMERKVQRPGLRAVRRGLLPGQVTRLRGLPVTDEARTAVDLLASWPWDAARDLLAWLYTRNRLNATELGLWTETRATCIGTPQLRRLAELSARGSLSAAEDVFHGILTSGGLVGWRANAPIVLAGRVVAVADVLFEDHRLVIEVDGWRSHGSRSAFQRDRATQNALVAAGYTVLRFTWADLRERSDHVLRTVQQALARTRRSSSTQ